MTIEPVGNGAVIRLLGHVALHRPDDENGGDVIAELVLAAKADHDAIVAEVRRMRAALVAVAEHEDTAEDTCELTDRYWDAVHLGRELAKRGGR